MRHIIWPQNEQKHRVRTSEWKKENPKKVKEQTDRRRANKLDAFVEDVDLTVIWQRDAGLCILCGFPAEKENWWEEHLIPLSRGGTHSYANVFVSHKECNLEKLDKTMDEYLEYLERKDWGN